MIINIISKNIWSSTWLYHHQYHIEMYMIKYMIYIIINNIIISWSSISYQNIYDQVHDYIIINIISKYKWSSTWFILLSITSSYHIINNIIISYYQYHHHIILSISSSYDIEKYMIKYMIISLSNIIIISWSISYWKVYDQVNHYQYHIATYMIDYMLVSSSTYMIK